MQKLYILGLIAALSVFSSNLQSQEFRGGIVAGIAGTQVMGDGLSGPNKAGICIGPYVNLALSDKTSIQMQLELMQKGSRQNPDSTNNFNSYLLRLNYVQVPLMFQYQYNQYFGFEAGASYGVLFSSYEEVNGYTAPLISGEDFKDRDLSLHAGIHWYLSDNLKAEFEFSHSLLYIRGQEVKGPTMFFNNGEYNHVLLLAVQYQIENMFGY